MPTRRLVIPQHDRVRVSVILLVLKDPDIVLASIASIVDTVDSSIPYEVIVVCNGLPAEDVTSLERFARGARLVICNENTGFSGGCNIGAAAARADYLLFLNDDTIVEPRSIAMLIRALDELPQAGAVGSMMLFSDGTIQECGSILWSDGSTFPVGRGRPATSQRYAYRRKVDYCSACSLLVRRSVFEAIGGFDESYFPAYYEDVDFALKMREAGYATYVEPLSRVRHLEGASTTSRFRQFLFARNKQRFRQKWSAQLSLQPDPAPTSAAAVERAVALARGLPIRVLVCDDRLPADDLGSGFGRLLELLRDLAGPHFAIAFAVGATSAGDHDDLSRRGIELIDVPLEEYLREPGIFFDVVVISRPHNFERWAPAVRESQPAAILIYDAEALFFRRMNLQASFSESETEAAMLRHEAARWEAIERNLAIDADRVVCISDDEHAYLTSIPDHVPIELMRPMSSSASFIERDFAARNDVLFVAGWLAGPTSPNVDGFVWFVDEVWPIVLRAVPDARFLVTGSNPPEAVRNRFGDRIVGLGRVPDLADAYGSVRAAVAPIRYGSGVKIKTIEALQYGCPVVATKVGAEGLALTDGVAIDICDAPEAFAARTISLLTDASRWTTRRTEIRALLELWERDRHNTWDAIIERAISEAQKNRRAKVQQHA